MELPPSVYTTFVERRSLQAWEMYFGGQGQRYISGGNCFVAPSGYMFYKINFLTTTVLSAVGIYGQYNMLGGMSYSGASFPANANLYAPLTSVCLSGLGGTAIAYMARIRFIGCGETCTTVSNDVTL